MKRKTRLIAWLISGGVLALGPIWGMIGTIVGMISAFQKIGQETVGNPEALASDISLAMYTTAAGWIACPIGIAIIIVSAIKLGRSGTETQGVPNNTPDGICQPADGLPKPSA